MPNPVQPRQVVSTGALGAAGHLSSDQETSEDKSSTTRQPGPFRVDDFIAFTNNVIGQARNVRNQAVVVVNTTNQVLNDPRTQALARVIERNPRLANVLLRLGTSRNTDISNFSKEDLTLVIDNIDFLQETGFLEIIKNEINDPRFEAFLKLREKNKPVADRLAHLFVKAVTTPNFGIDDITSDEILLIANNLKLMEETGFLSAIKDDLQDGIKKVLNFRENNPRLFGAALAIGNTFPGLIDFGKSVAKNPARGYFALATTAIGAIGLGVLTFWKLRLLVALPILPVALIVGGIFGFALSGLFKGKS